MSHAEDSGPLHLRMLCAVLATACTFVPIPFVDDILRKRVLHFMVRQTQRAHGRTYSSTHLFPLYSESRGCVTGCLFVTVKVPLKLLLFPIRKILAWLEEEARRIKLAFEEASRGFDVGVLSDLIGAAAGKAAGLWSAAARSLRRMFGRKSLEEIDSSISDAERAVIDEGADRLEEVLSRPEAVEVLEAFDRAFDERLEAKEDSRGTTIH